MTTTSTDDSAAAVTAAILRAVADLIETHPDIPLPAARVSFYVHGDDTPGVIAAIAAALPCQWRAEVSRGSAYEWLNLTSDTGSAGSVLHGTQVHISAPAADACTEAGARTVTVWQPVSALAGLLGSGPLPEVTR